MVEVLDPRNIRTGSDGELYSMDGDFLAEVNTFVSQVNITNTNYQPAGSKQEVAVFSGYNVTLTFTETVVKDKRLLKKFMDALERGEQVQFNFQGLLRGDDGTSSRQIYRSCVPDGAIDLLNINPGDIVRRAWNFRVNKPPKLQELLGGS